MDNPYIIKILNSCIRGFNTIKSILKEAVSDSSFELISETIKKEIK